MSTNKLAITIDNLLYLVGKNNLKIIGFLTTNTSKKLLQNIYHEKVKELFSEVSKNNNKTVLLEVKNDAIFYNNKRVDDLDLFLSSNQDNIIFISLGNITENPISLKHSIICNAVVLLEKVGKTRYNNLETTQKLLHHRDIDVLGVITY